MRQRTQKVIFELSQVFQCFNLVLGSFIHAVFWLRR